MTDADKHMLKTESHDAVPWERFGPMMAERGEIRAEVMEIRHYEEGTIAPVPAADNDVIVATVLVVWRETLISTLNVAVKPDWPIGQGAHVLGMMFRDLTAGPYVHILLGSKNVDTAFK